MSEIVTISPATECATLTLKAIAHHHQPLSLLDMPAEIRLEIYSHLLPDKRIFPTGITETRTNPSLSLREDCQSSPPAILLTCKKIYDEAAPFFYHDRCFSFEIAGHLLRSVVDRHKPITSVRFRAWLELSSYFNADWRTCDFGGLDYTRLEAANIVFWPMHGCTRKLVDARNVATELVSKLQQAQRLTRISISFRDEWTIPLDTAAGITCRQLTEVESLLEPFRALKGLKNVEIKMPVFRAFEEHRDFPCRPLLSESEDSERVMEGQMQYLEETRDLMRCPREKGAHCIDLRRPATFPIRSRS